MADLTGEGVLIGQALRDLQTAWAASADGWQDMARADIERSHLDPIQARAREAARAVQMLADLVKEAERACS